MLHLIFSIAHFLLNQVDSCILDQKGQNEKVSEKFKENEEQLCSVRNDIQMLKAGQSTNEIDRTQNENIEQYFDKIEPMCDQVEPLQNVSVKKTQLSFDDDSQSEESEEEMGDILDHFVTTTSMHGIGQIIGNKWIVLRILWILLTLSALGGLIFHLYSIIDSYRQWPKQTQVSVGLNNSVYPAITICNENLILKSALENMDALSSLRSFVNNTSQVVFAEKNSSSSGPDLKSRKVKVFKSTFY